MVLVNGIISNAYFCSAQTSLTWLYNVLTFVFTGCKKGSMWHVTGASKFRTILASLQFKKQDARKMLVIVLEEANNECNSA